MRSNLLWAMTALVLLTPAGIRAQELTMPSDTVGAATAGSLAGESRSTASVALVSGGLSFTVPGAGFLYLLFLDSGEVEPSFVEQQELARRGPVYTRVWSDNFDRALTERQKRSIIIASTIGSVLGLSILYNR